MQGVKDLISGEVLKRVTSLESALATTPVVSARLASRRRQLKQWCKYTRPLAHDRETEETLLDAISDSSDDVRLGLPAIDQPSISISDFVDGLVCAADGRRSTRLHGVRVVPPRSAAEQTLKIAIPKMRNVVRQCKGPAGDPDKLIANIFGQVIGEMKIHYIPFVDIPRGPRFKKPQYDCWIMLISQAATDIIESNDELLSPDQIEQRDATRAQRRAQKLDPRLEWACGTIALSNLQSILHCESLPTDWKLSRSRVPWIDHISDWMPANFDIRNPIHHYAILASIILSTTLPYIFLPKSPDIPNCTDLTAAEIREVGLGLKWTMQSEGRGHKDKPAFISMMTTFIIALACPDGPLAVHLRQNENVMGADWTKRNCELSDPLSFAK